MNREQAESLLARMLADELDEPTRAELNAYLETDSSLREQLADMRLTAQLLRDAAAAEGEPRLSAKRMVKLKKLADGPRQSFRIHREVIFSFRTWGSIAAALLLMVGLAGIMMPSLVGFRVWHATDHTLVAMDDITGGTTIVDEEFEQEESGRLRYQITDGHFEQPPSFDLSIVASDSDGEITRGGSVFSESGVGGELDAQAEKQSSDWSKSTARGREPGTRWAGPNVRDADDIDKFFGDLPQASKTFTESRESGRSPTRDLSDLANKPASTGGPALNPKANVDFDFQKEFAELEPMDVASAEGTENYKYDSTTTERTGIASGRRVFPEEAELQESPVEEVALGTFSLSDGGGSGKAGNQNLFSDDEAINRQADPTGQAGGVADWSVAIDARKKDVSYDPEVAKNAPRVALETQKSYVSDLEPVVAPSNTADRPLPTSPPVGGPEPKAEPMPGGDASVGSGTAPSDTPTTLDTIVLGGSINGGTAGENGSRIGGKYGVRVNTSGDVDGLPTREGEGRPADLERLESTDTDRASQAAAVPGETFSRYDNTTEKYGDGLKADDLTEAAARLRNEIGAGKRELDALYTAIDGTQDMSQPGKQSERDKSKAENLVTAKLRRERGLERIEAALAASKEASESGDIARAAEAARKGQALLKADRGYLDEDRYRELKREANALPHSELLVYPADWPELTRRRLVDDVKADIAAGAKLKQPIPVDFNENRLENVVEYYRNVTGTNVHVDWKSLEAAGVARDTPITMRLSNVSAEKALGLTLEQAGGNKAELGFGLDQGIVVIDTKAGLAARRAQAAGEAEKPVDITELPTASTFRSFPVNPWVLTEKDHQSTFALDTDSASYTLCRNYIRAGYLPPAGAVRMEEFINAFDYQYPTADDQTFTVHAEAAPAPFAAAGRNTVLLKVGVKGKVIGRDGRKPMHLVFVVDASGSMAREDRLPLVRYALGQLSMQLQNSDRVSLITYGTDAKLHLEAAPAGDPAKVISAINNIQPGGSTNLLQGIEKAYQIAGRHFKSGQVNRVILCSDGVANIGETDAEQMLARVDAYRKQGITFTAAGFGMGGLNDALLEQLANKGDGNYLFVDTKAEAYRAFVTDMTATLQTIAKDAKIQVEFNPARVRRYRLVGYENRDIADKDFRNDAIDAGEVGSGQSATALYELELTGPIRSDERLPQLGTVYVRYKDVDTNAVEEISRLLSSNLIELRTPQSNPRFYLAASAGAFAELLRQSPHARDVNPTRVLRVLEEVAVALPLDRQVAELRDLVRASIDLPPAP
jgi:Ca-activated chloride channel family protein